MPSPRVVFRLRAHKDTALKKAPSILQKNLKGGLLSLAKRLQASARTRMRKDTGEAHKSLTYRVSVKGLNMNLIVYSTLVQAFVDAYGLRRGVFPDFGVNSRLYNWVKRRMRGFPIKQVRKVGVPKQMGQFTKARRARRARIRVNRRVRKIAGPRKPLNATGRARAKTSDVRRLAFLVARAIYRRGVEATQWPKKTLEANRSRIIRDMSNALARSVNEIKRA